MVTAYDAVSYPSKIFPQTQPNRLALHAHLLGLPWAPLETCRVLDIGGGDGANLMPLAQTWPKARFVCLDLAESAISRGRTMAAALGLSNLEFVAGDLTAVDLEAGSFDYVISHGVYSWVSEPVRRALMRVIARVLAPGGIAFVSYNAFPGCRARQALRDILLFQVRGLDDPLARAEAARAYLDVIIDTYPEGEPIQAVIKDEARVLKSRELEVLAHDTLSAVYHPVLFSDFVAAAARVNLAFLTEAEATRGGEGFIPDDAAGDPHFDVIGQAQRFDFKAARYFRQSLLVHKSVTIDRRADPVRVFDLHVGSPARRGEDGVFAYGDNRFEITDPSMAEAIATVSDAWPDTCPVRDIIADPERAMVLLRMYWAGAVELRVAPFQFVKVAGERPEANPLARLQAKSGATLLAGLRHALIEVEDPFSREFIAGLDGTRVRAELVRDIGKRLDAPPEAVSPVLEANLAALARMPMLIR